MCLPWLESWRLLQGQEKSEIHHRQQGQHRRNDRANGQALLHPARWLRCGLNHDSGGSSTRRSRRDCRGGRTRCRCRSHRSRGRSRRRSSRRWGRSRRCDRSGRGPGRAGRRQRGQLDGGRSCRLGRQADPDSLFFRLDLARLLFRRHCATRQIRNVFGHKRQLCANLSRGSPGCQTRIPGRRAPSRARNPALCQSKWLACRLTDLNHPGFCRMHPAHRKSRRLQDCMGTVSPAGETCRSGSSRTLDHSLLEGRVPRRTCSHSGSQPPQSMRCRDHEHSPGPGQPLLIGPPTLCQPPGHRGRPRAKRPPLRFVRPRLQRSDTRKLHLNQATAAGNTPRHEAG